jgi:hypothetical protein
MARIEKRIVKGHNYWYLVESYRDEQKSAFADWAAETTMRQFLPIPDIHNLTSQLFWDGIRYRKFKVCYYKF